MEMFFVFWVACGVLGFGWCFGYFQREYTLIAAEQRTSDIRMSVMVAITGPIGLLTMFAVTGRPRHGLKFW